MTTPTPTLFPPAPQTGLEAQPDTPNPEPFWLLDRKAGVDKTPAAAAADWIANPTEQPAAGDFYERWLQWHATHGEDESLWP